jgi:hypothetical protein
MILTDSVHSSQLLGDYGFYDELADSSFVTGRALLKEYGQGDTLYLHGRVVQTFRSLDSTAVAADSVRGIVAHTRVDTTHVAVVYPRVRFYRSDIQGVCDSMRFTERDSMMRMFVSPVLWNEDRQVSGNRIDFKLNDSTIERAILPDYGFTAQHIEGEHYNQLSGKEMIAWFEGGELCRLDINGNVEIIMYPEESDSTINKIVNAESSFLTATFRGRTTERIKLWPETTGTATPLFIARKTLYYLPKFVWHEGVRPMSPSDVFVIPEAMERMMEAAGRPAPSAIAPKRRSPVAGIPETRTE